MGTLKHENFEKRREVAVDPRLFDKYLGRYELRPDFILTPVKAILFEQAAGQPKFELFAESVSDYFLKVTDAQFTF